ncbi:hypothetical protein BDV06DRAFT_228944, partial [Aspergillus oleicola]
HEFSRFDQGPLEDQPAFVPEDSPVEETAPELPPKPEPKEEPKEKPVAPVAPISSHGNASHDRWAQIRKNAAERIIQSEARPGTADDDGNTSEEESFETRAARIKARVAELTGNMQAANRS